MIYKKIYKGFDDFFEKEFKTQYIADGDWTEVIFCGEEFGMSPSPDREIENFRDIAECTWDYHQKHIAELERKLKIASEVISFALDNIDEIEGFTQDCEECKKDIRKTLEHGVSEIKEIVEGD